MTALAELHAHLEGTAPPELVGRLARRNGLSLPDGMLDRDGRFHFSDFDHFLATYDLAASVIRTPEDYRDITFEYLASIAADGAIYSELTASPDHAALVGLSEAGMLEGIVAGIDDARAAHGIEARILFVAVKNLGVQRAVQIARRVADRPHPYVVGLSMAGNEHWPATDFAKAYQVAAGAGAGCTFHAGEWGGPESIRPALEIPITRIDHGVRAIEDPDLVAELAEREIVLTVCPTSNIALGVFPSLEDHPLPALVAAGVRCTLATDDPPYFGATLGGEYELARERFGFSEATLAQMTATAIDNAFCEPELKRALIARLKTGERLR